MSPARRRGVGLLLEIGAPVVLIALWAVLSAGSKSFYFPPFGDIMSAFRENWLFGRLESDVLPSMSRLLMGYALAVVLGIALGVLLGLWRSGREAANPILEFLRAIPAPALIPVAIAVVGIGSSMKVFIIVMVCLWPVLLNTIDGVSAVDPTLRDTVRVYDLRRRDRLLRVWLPAASPQIVAGMRSAMSLALVMMVVSEMVASTNGIGFFVLQSQRSFAIPDMWSGIVLLGLLGYALNLIFVVVESRVLSWHKAARATSSS